MVVSEDGRSVLGIISERDVVRGLAERGPRILDVQVSELMTRDVVSCAPRDTVKQVMAEMTRRRIRHLPVVAEGVLCGIVSIGDVVKNRLEEMETDDERPARGLHRSNVRVPGDAFESRRDEGSVHPRSPGPSLLDLAAAHLDGDGRARCGAPRCEPQGRGRGSPPRAGRVADRQSARMVSTVRSMGLDLSR